MFPHISRAMSSAVFKSYGRVKELIEYTYTEGGLRVTADISNKIYEKGKKPVIMFMATEALFLTTFQGTLIIKSYLTPI